ncbi:3-dehydroquinate synthase [Caldiplasma sukawensis]
MFYRKTFEIAGTTEDFMLIDSEKIDKINFDSNSYAIVSQGLLDSYKFIYKLFDENRIITVMDGENGKSMESAIEVVEKLNEMNVERDAQIVAIGGGTVGDLAGFLSSIYKRGLRISMMPTTILSMVDSSIGGKNGINFKNIKNLIGTFRFPEKIVDIIDFVVGKKNLFEDGLGEIIKHGFSLNYKIIDILMKKDVQSYKNQDYLGNIIMENVDAKMSICMKDPFEREHIREVLNIGHTIGHAVEAVTENRIKHGIAVIYGTIIENRIALNLKLTDFDVEKRLKNILKSFEIQLNFSENFNSSEIARYIMNDKKLHEGKLNFPIITGKGTSRVEPIRIEKFLNMLNNVSLEI